MLKILRVNVEKLIRLHNMFDRHILNFLLYNVRLI